MPAPDLTSDNYYKLLGVEKDASDAEIKKAFRRLAIKYHPDKAKGDKEKATENFKKISEAYEVLSDKEKRKTYDNFGKQGVNGQGFNFTNPDDLFSQVFGHGQGGDPFANMFTEAFFGGGGGGRNQTSFSFSSGGADPMRDVFAQFLGGGGMSQGFGMGGPAGGFSFGGMPGMNGTRSRRQRQSYDCYKKGTIVFVKNLQKQTWLNDYQGVIKGYDRAKRRYLVEVDDVGERSLKRENLMQLIQNVKIIGLKSKPQLNGKTGIVFDSERARNRCTIRVDKQNLSLSCENLIFPKDTVVEIVGLKKGTQYNGRMGTIVDIDNYKQRYTLQLSVTEKLSVRFGNVFV